MEGIQAIVMCELILDVLYPSDANMTAQSPISENAAKFVTADKTGNASQAMNTHDGASRTVGDMVHDRVTTPLPTRQPYTLAPETVNQEPHTVLADPAGIVQGIDLESKVEDSGMSDEYASKLARMVDYVPCNVAKSKGRGRIIIFEDNDAVIKCTIKGRAPTLNPYVGRTHRIDLDWLFERLREDPSVYIRYVPTAYQMADLFTKGSFMVATWQRLCTLAQIGSLASLSGSCEPHVEEDIPAPVTPKKKKPKTKTSAVGSKATRGKVTTPKTVG